MPPKTPSVPPSSLSVDDSLPFRFIGGDLSLDLINTVDWTPRGPENDRIGGYDRLIAWAVSAGIIDEAESARLERRMFARRGEAAVAYERARALRWTLRRLVAALATGDRAGPSVRLPLEELNGFVADVFGQVRLAIPAVNGAGTLPNPTWSWADGGGRFDAILWPVVRRAAELLASDDVRRLRVCPGQDCGWVYVDRSRNGLRRWCDMATCGTREKTRRRRAQQR